MVLLAACVTQRVTAAETIGPPPNPPPPVTAPPPPPFPTISRDQSRNFDSRMSAAPRQTKWRAIFPPNPPPLGVSMPAAGSPQSPLLLKARTLSGEVLEPYFAPLSAALLEPELQLDKKDSAMLADYRRRRTALLADVRRVIAEVETAAAPARLTAFVALAAAQEPELLALEKSAEAFRARLAWEVNWDQFRQWHLHRRDLRSGRERTAVLEMQVIRAAAFFMADLTPAQRRLLREAAWRLEDQIFAERKPASDFFQFFSPDLMQVHFPEQLPPGLAAEIAQFAAQKEALRQELRDTLYEADGASVFGSQRAIRRVASEQEPRITALEDFAEKIRRELADWGTTWRRSPPAPLSAAIAPRLETLVAAVAQQREKLFVAIEPIVSARPPFSVSPNSAATVEWEDQQQEKFQQATATFEHEHADETKRLDDEAAILDQMLASDYQPDDGGVTPRERILEFAHRRAVETAYYEYDIAAFEPGLSPRQRNLLFAAAIARLELRPPQPEEQPVRAPETLIR